jgi:ABC-2 type transport system permease protein
MAVYKRGYQRYQGSITGRWTRLLVLPGYEWRRLLKQRLMVSLLIMGIFWPLGCLGFIYLSNHAELLLNFDPGIKKFLQIDSSFFLIFMKVQAVFSILISVFAAPSLVAPDLSNNALQLYFSRPFSRAEYVLARLIVLLGLLSLITWIPGILLFSMQSGMAGWNWFAENWNLGLGVFIGFMLWILLVSLVSLTGSAYVRRRIMAEALILGVIFVLPVGTKIFNTVFNVVWASLFNPLQVMNQIWCWLLGATPESGPTVSGCWMAVAVMAAVLMTVLRRKLRPVEVVS